MFVSGYITVDGNEGDRNNLTAWHGGKSSSEPFHLVIVNSSDWLPSDTLGDDLILTVAGNNSNTIVVVHSVGPMIVEPWIDHPNVTAVIWAGLPGQESGMPLLHVDSFHYELILYFTMFKGNALRDVLYGNWNPSGKLPYTIARSVTDYGGGIITDTDPVCRFHIPLTLKLIF